MPERAGPEQLTPEQIKEIQEQQRAAQEEFASAAKALSERIDTDDDLKRTTYALLLSYRLAHWAVSELCSMRGMTNPMVKIAVDAQRHAALQPFDFVETMDDLVKQQLPWLESRRRELLAQRNTRIKRVKEMVLRLRRKDIPLPFHSMTALFNEDGFRHGDDLVVFGDRVGLRLVLQRCSMMYAKAGGHVVLLTNDMMHPPPKHVATKVVPPQIWCNAGQIYADMKELLDPLIKGMMGKPIGMIVIEDIDNMLTEQAGREPRRVRLARVAAMLAQYRAERGIAMIVGVATDDDSNDYEQAALYPPFLLTSPNIRISLQDSALVGGSPVVIVGNDVIQRSKLCEQLEGEK